MEAPRHSSPACLLVSGGACHHLQHVCRRHSVLQLGFTSGMLPVPRRCSAEARAAAQLADHSFWLADLVVQTLELWEKVALDTWLETKAAAHALAAAPSLAARGAA